MAHTVKSVVPVDVWVLWYPTDTPKKERAYLLTSDSGIAWALLKDGTRKRVGATAFLTEEAARKRCLGRMDKVAQSHYLRTTLPDLYARAAEYIKDKPPVYKRVTPRGNKESQEGNTRSAVRTEGAARDLHKSEP